MPPEPWLTPLPIAESMESYADDAPSRGDKGLKKDAIGFSDGLTIALASTAPAYSLAAVIGSIVVIVGFQAPAALLVSFVPMFFIAAAFYYMNRADQDCGTSFSWVTRAIGPQIGLDHRLGDLRHRHPRRRLARRRRRLLLLRPDRRRVAGRKHRRRHRCWRWR